MAHIHSVFDSNEHFVIDPVTRSITSSLAKKIVVMQYDHNSERFTFKIPKLVDGHNMAVCDKVEIHYINIDGVDKSLKSTGVYEVDDIQPSPEDNNFSVFSWLLSRNATKYAGTLNFLIHFACTVDGVEEYAWNTAIFQSITIGNGMNNGAEVIEPYTDIIAQWKANLFGVGDTEEQRLLNVSAEQQAAIAAKGAAVLDSIPDEYEALQAQADENTRIKAGAIVLKAEGGSIVANDASDCHLYGLKLFGKSTQDGTPTPDAPVDIVSVEKPVVTVCGRNLWNHENDTVDMTQLSGWGSAIWRTDTVVRVLKPNTTYTMRFAVTCLSVPEYESVFSDDCGFVLYSPKESGRFLTLAMSKGEGALSVGEKRTATCTFTTPDDVNDVSMGYEILRYVQRFKKADGTAVYATAKFEDVQLELGDTVTAYEPYNGGVFETVRTLPGIPVTSGGNYTDPDGQRWICDEVDLARGVYVQRIKQLVLNGSESWGISGSQYIYLDLADYAVKGGDGWCSHFDFWYNYGGDCVFASEKWIYLGNVASNRYNLNVKTWKEFLSGNNVTLLYILETPIETPLSDAEINAFRVLHSNKPNTTILNDAGAFMAVEYVADTKTYIDHKIKEMMEGSEQT